MATSVGFIYVGRVDDFGWSYVQDLGRHFLKGALGPDSVTTMFEESVEELGCTLLDDLPWRKYLCRQAVPCSQTFFVRSVPFRDTCRWIRHLPKLRCIVSD